MSSNKEQFNRVEAMSQTIDFTNTFAPYSDKVFAKILNTKKVTTTAITREDIHYAMQTIDAINSLSPYEYTLSGRPFSEIHLGKWMIPFLFPRKVSIMSNFGAKDILDRPSFPDDYVYSEERMHFIICALAQAMKSDISSEDLGSALEPSALVNWDRASFNGMVSSTDPCVPWPIKAALEDILFAEFRYSIPAGSIISDFILGKGLTVA